MLLREKGKKDAEPVGMGWDEAQAALQAGEVAVVREGAVAAVSAAREGQPLAVLVAQPEVDRPGFLGLALGIIGIDQLTGDARFSFGIPQLLDGIDVLILVIGLFAVGETLYQAWRHGREPDEVVALQPFTGMSRDDWRRSWKPWLRGTALGFPFGAIPAGGAEIPTFLSYLTERKFSKHPEEFGRVDPRAGRVVAIAPSPDFAQDRLVYLLVVGDGPTRVERLARGDAARGRGTDHGEQPYGTDAEQRAGPTSDLKIYSFDPELWSK